MHTGAGFDHRYRDGGQHRQSALREVPKRKLFVGEPFLSAPCAKVLRWRDSAGFAAKALAGPA